MINDHYPDSGKEDRGDPERFRMFKNRSQWRWLQWLHGWLVQDVWERKRRHAIEREYGYRLHLGGVFNERDPRLDK